MHRLKLVCLRKKLDFLYLFRIVLIFIIEYLLRQRKFFFFPYLGDLNKVEIDKGFDALGGRLSITPRYNLASSEADVTIGYDSNETTVTIDASKSQQKLTVSQQILDGHRITPSITSSGDISVAYRKDLDNGNSLTTTVSPGDKVNVKWEDGPWVAEFDTALNGLKTEGLAVRVHRKVTFV